MSSTTWIKREWNKSISAIMNILCDLELHAQLRYKKSEGRIRIFSDIHKLRNFSNHNAAHFKKKVN